MAAENDWFHREEYIALRQEVMSIFAQRDQYLFLSMGACGVIIAWLTLNATALPRYFWLSPLIIVLVAYVVVRDRSAQMAKIGAYLKRLETVYSRAELDGWEHYQSAGRSQYPFFRGNRILWISFALAMMLFAAQRFV